MAMRSEGGRSLTNNDKAEVSFRRGSPNEVAKARCCLCDTKVPAIDQLLALSGGGTSVWYDPAGCGVDALTGFADEFDQQNALSLFWFGAIGLTLDGFVAHDDGVVRGGDRFQRCGDHLHRFTNAESGPGENSRRNSRCFAPAATPPQPAPRPAAASPHAARQAGL